MSKPTLQSIHVELEKHMAVSDERWVETITRIKRIEHILIGQAAAVIVLLLADRF
jgi:threonine synthase